MTNGTYMSASTTLLPSLPHQISPLMCYCGTASFSCTAASSPCHLPRRRRRPVEAAQVTWSADKLPIRDGLRSSPPRARWWRERARLGPAARQPSAKAGWTSRRRGCSTPATLPLTSPSPSAPNLVGRLTTRARLLPPLGGRCSWGSGAR